MNSFLTWLSANIELNDFVPKAPQAHIVHPITTSSLGGQVKRLLTGKRWAGRPLSKFYDKGGFNPGHEMVDFYASFHNYLSTTALWEMPFRAVGALFGLVLWYCANAVQWFYVMSYRLLNLHLIEQLARAGRHTGHFTVSQLFVDCNRFGLFVFGIVLLCYVIGTTINSPTYERYKNIFRNVVLILFMLIALPNLTTAFSDGVNDIASGMFQGETTSHPEDNPSNLANLAYEQNVVSIPMRVQNTTMGSNMATDHVYRFHGKAPIPGVKVNPVYIDLYQMRPSERNKWNGFNKQTVPSFLANYVNPQEAVNDDSIKDYADRAKGGKRNAIARGVHSVTGFTNDTSDIMEDFHIPGGSILHYLSSQGSKVTGSWASQSFENIFQYHVGSYGLKSGSALSSYSLQKYPQFSFLGNVASGAGSTITTKPFYRSYGYYSVNWLGIYEQLIMVILIVGAYLFKTFELVFKNVIMYISSGLLLLRNADNYQRIKYFFRSLFSIYEMAIMDIIMCYTSMYILYPAYHQFNAWLLVKADNAYIANRWTVILINLIGDIALFTIAVHGTTTVDAMVGPAGGGAKSGASGYFGSMLALRGGNAVMRGAKGIGHLGIAGAEAPFKAGRDLIGAKGAGNAFASRNADKSKGAFSSVKDAMDGKKQAKQDHAETAHSGRGYDDYKKTGFGGKSPNKPGNATDGDKNRHAFSGDSPSRHSSRSNNVHTGNATSGEQSKHGLNHTSHSGSETSADGSNSSSPVTDGDTAVSGSDVPNGALSHDNQQSSESSSSTDDTDDNNGTETDSTDDSDVADNAVDEDDQADSASGALDDDNQPQSLGNGQYDFGGHSINPADFVHGGTDTSAPAHHASGAISHHGASQHSTNGHSNSQPSNSDVTHNGGNHDSHDNHGTGALNDSPAEPTKPSDDNGGGAIGTTTADDDTATGASEPNGTTTGTDDDTDTDDNSNADNQTGAGNADNADVADDTPNTDDATGTGALNDDGINGDTGTTDTTDDTATDDTDTDVGDTGTDDSTGSVSENAPHTDFTGQDYGFGSNGQPLVHGASQGVHDIDQDVDKTDTTTNTHDVDDNSSQPSFTANQPDVTTNNGSRTTPHYDFTNRNWGVSPSNKTVTHRHVHKHHKVHNVTRHHRKGNGHHKIDFGKM